MTGPFFVPYFLKFSKNGPVLGLKTNRWVSSPSYFAASLSGPGAGKVDTVMIPKGLDMFLAAS